MPPYEGSVKRVLGAIVAAAAAFVLVAAPAGVLGMIDEDYCFDHPDRPPQTISHEETLSFLPPGPVCTFSAEGGSTVVAGPGWWPAIAAGAGVVAGVGALRLSP